MRLSFVEALQSRRGIRYVLLAAVYTAVIVLSFFAAFVVRFDFRVPSSEWRVFAAVLAWMLPLKLLLLYVFGQFRSLLSYFGVPDAYRIGVVCVIAAIGQYLPWVLDIEALAPPRSIIVLDFLFSLVGLVSVRMGFRTFREMTQRAPDLDATHRRNVALIGAGDVGAALAKDILSRPNFGMKCLAFFDDDEAKWDTTIHGIPVIGKAEDLRAYHRELDIEQVIITMPSAPASRIREIVSIATELGMRCETVPSVGQMVSGRVQVTRLRQVEIQDLLGRPPVSLEGESIRKMIEGRRVLVTGGGGSIGSELCRQIYEFNPEVLILVERCEPLAFLIGEEIHRTGRDTPFRMYVADILHTEGMRRLFEEHRPEIVFHAAAHKHVPLMEQQPLEAVENNAMGTAGLADLAIQNQVDRFVMISTDKAINPTNVMGVSKRLAECYLRQLNDAEGSRTRFMAVRFGNVLGSSGSVVPTFKSQIANGGPVTVTHPEVTRFFMTIPEAVGLVLQASTMGKGGEIFVLDMGQPIKIIDLARQLIQLSGFQPDVDIEIKITGLRPGEKLYEELTHLSEEVTPTEHPRILQMKASASAQKITRSQLETLLSEMAVSTPSDMKNLLQQLVSEYQPHGVLEAKLSAQHE